MDFHCVSEHLFSRAQETQIFSLQKCTWIIFYFLDKGFHEGHQIFQTKSSSKCHKNANFNSFQCKNCDANLPVKIFKPIPTSLFHTKSHRLFAATIGASLHFLLLPQQTGFIFFKTWTAQISIYILNSYTIYISHERHIFMLKLEKFWWKAPRYVGRYANKHLSKNPRNA